MNTNKVFVIGVDGMDPKMTRRMVDEGKLPNIKRFIELGAARHDLVMLGAMPTITPPMWTTLCTGAYPSTHGITCYWNQHPTDLGRFEYAFESHKCKAEQIWNVIAEAGKKVLVWTWPGASWPPSSPSNNLHVVGGMSPSGPNTSGCNLESEVITHASIESHEISRRGKKELKGGAGCVLDGVVEVAEDEAGNYISSFQAADNKAFLLLDHHEGEELNETPEIIITYDVPIKAPSNWSHSLPIDALEFPVICSDGRKQLPALMLKNEQGDYDRIEIYMSKKEAEPLAKIQDGEYLPAQVMNLMVDGQSKKGTRSMTIMAIDPKGKGVSVSLGTCLDIEGDVKTLCWHPSSLYQQTLDAAGYIPVTYSLGGGYSQMVTRRSLPSWDYFEKWQSQALLQLIEENHYDAVFTHIHNVDHVGHICWRWGKSRKQYGDNDEKEYQGYLEAIYLQTDDYVGRLMGLIDQGWTLIITSDHGMLCGWEDEIPYLGEGFVMNVGVMEELGYTVLKRDDQGRKIREIDWSKTRAVAPRGNHIYLNLKGRNDYGIVEPADKYELERQIIDDLYAYRFSGKRVVNVALRNKDALLLGMSGEKCGDIIYFVEEGFNRLHGDALSTTEGYFGTSVSPIFIAAGPGVKSGYTTNRVIREVDVAPTVAAIMGLRMPAQSEGSPVHQIIPS